MPMNNQYASGAAESRPAARDLRGRLGLRHPGEPPNLAAYQSRLGKLPARSGGARLSGVVRQSLPGKPLVSIVTVVLNRAAVLRRALDSIRAQTYSNIEYILVDGGSTDGTLDVIREYEDIIDLWISEPDRGIYDAFNKGIALATGDYIGILNSDDYYEPDQLANAVAALQATGADWVFGDIWMHGWQNRSTRIGGDPAYTASIRRTMPAIHQVNALAHRSLFEKHGLFRTEYRIAADYDWFLRITIAGAGGHHDPRILSHMSYSGISARSQRLAIREGFYCAVRNGLPLRDAVPHWGGRYAYPDGVPPKIAAAWNSTIKLRQAVRLGPIGFAYVVLRRMKRTIWRLAGRPTAPGEDSKSNRFRMLAAFIRARHLGDELDEATLLALFDLGRANPRCAVLAQGPPYWQAGIMLEASGRRLTAGKDAVVIVAPVGRLRDLVPFRKGCILILLDHPDKAASPAVPVEEAFSTATTPHLVRSGEQMR